MPSEFQKTTQQGLERDVAEAKARSSAIGDDVRETAENLRGEFASSAEGVREQAGDMAESVKKRTRAMADDQKDAGADQLHGFARAIDEAADQLANEFPQAASYVHEAAQRVDNVSTMIRERSIEELLHEANHFARKNTIAFFGMSLAAGFALSRFLKSSAPARDEPAAETRCYAAPAQPQPEPFPDTQPHPPERLASFRSSQF
jgi:ElaB/YqjD/DUF883 family membrane-anchored ribosome-binding protein